MSAETAAELRKALVRSGWDEARADTWIAEASDRWSSPAPLVRLRGLATVESVSREAMRLALLYRAQIKAIRYRAV